MKVLVEKDGPITTVIINRPEVRNAVDAETAVALRDAFRAFDEDEEARVAVLCGAGGCFCAGYDLRAIAARGLRGPSEREGEGPMGPSRVLLSKPVIAAVDGYAVAGGLELAIWCDLRVMEEDANVGVFCRRWGVPLVDGGTVRLPRLIGMSRALDMILTGRPVGAAEALSWGLANRVVPKGQARAEAQKLAREIAGFPQLCLRTDRMSAYRQWDFSLEEALKFESHEGQRPLAQEAVEGARRFAAGAGRGGSFEDISHGR
ncbi:MAG: crotonase/enoyl-CoA hydratase family protein [Candidatus Rokubacteria bacterium]|nr:crotonase/enoyl-CoA hydratase family protein [Candidatus Rokubacteria bacterium]